MSNPLEVIGKGIETGAKDVAKGVEAAVKFAITDPVEFTEKTIAVLKAGLSDEPVVKTSLEGLVAQFNTTESAVAQAIAAKGLNVAGDIGAFTDVKALLDYFKSNVIPTVEKAYGDLKGAEQSN